jgi:carbon storage regulator CsrA
MLVLSRRPNETVVIPSINTTIRVTATKKNTVRIAFDAPAAVAILRGELSGAHASVASQPAESQAMPGDTDRPGDTGRLLIQIQDRLKGLATATGLAELLLDAHCLDAAKTTLSDLRDDLQMLRLGIEGETEEPSVKQPVAPRRALLVEDDRNERELLAGFLRGSGLTVDTAGDGADALSYLRASALPDVVLLDMGLPRCDGPTMIREIRRDPRLADLKVFAVSGYSPEELNLPRNRVDRWFQKPLDPNALLSDLNRELAIA